jgi:poly(3-hydroxyalkanoate) synthetase
LGTRAFDSTAKAPLITVPVIEVHATDDSFVPIRAARALFQRFPARKEMLELQGGHNDVGIPVGGSFRRALTRFWPVSG